MNRKKKLKALQKYCDDRISSDCGCERCPLYSSGIECCFYWKEIYKKSIDDAYNFVFNNGRPTYKVMDVAKYILAESVRDECPITNLQLQRVLYYAYKEFKRNGRILFEEPIKIHKFGAIVPQVYYAICGCGAMPIVSVSDNDVIKDRDRQIINLIIKETKDKNTHDVMRDIEEDDAWYPIWKGEL